MSIQTAERSSHREISDNFVNARHILTYQHALKYLGGNLLEVGSGEGYGIEIVIPHVSHYTAIDKYPIETAHLADKPFVFKQMEIPPFSGLADNTFDSVISFQVIEHIEDDEQFVKEIHRVLKPGGTALIATPNIKMSLTRNPWHVREYKKNELESLIKKYFGNVDTHGIFGNEKIMEYYQKNAESVRKITKWDIFDLQHKLPRSILQIPYDILNRRNRKKLLENNTGLVQEIQADDYFMAAANDQCFDFFCIAKK
jgi:2-polyprenyl-3-methyl-5-hydroxy-6-metoxy-1,4-benzoquinol methylase